MLVVCAIQDWPLARVSRSFTEAISWARSVLEGFIYLSLSIYIFYFIHIYIYIFGSCACVYTYIYYTMCARICVNILFIFWHCALSKFTIPQTYCPLAWMTLCQYPSRAKNQLLTIHTLTGSKMVRGHLKARCVHPGEDMVPPGEQGADYRTLFRRSCSLSTKVRQPGNGTESSPPVWEIGGGTGLGWL